MSNWLKLSQLTGTAFDAEKSPDATCYLPLGQLKSEGKDRSLSPLNYYGRAHMFCVAPSGSGKSQGLAIPALLDWPHSAIVLDVKGELYYHTAGYRQKTLGHKVLRFDPSDPNSHAFNPLAFIERGEFEIEQSVADIAEVIVRIPSDAKEKFFLSASRQIVEIALHYLLWQSPAAPPHLRDLIKLCYDIELFKTAIDKIAHHAPDRSLPDSIRNVAKGLRVQFFEPSVSDVDVPEGIDPVPTEPPVLTRTGQSVWAELSNHLSMLNTAQIKAVTQKTDWTPSDLRQNKTTVYVTLPPSAKGRYRAIMALVLNAHLGELLSQQPSRDAPPILLLLDEMPQLGYMRAIEQVIDLGRGYGLLLYAFSQRRQQIKKAYGDAGDFLGTFEARAYMNPSPEDGSADMLCKAIGERQRPGSGAQMVTVKVAPIHDLCGHEFRDDMIILSRGANPARVKKMMAYTNDRYQERMRITAPEGTRYAPIGK